MRLSISTRGQAGGKLEQLPFNRLTLTLLLVLATLSASLLASGAVSALKGETTLKLSAVGSDCQVSLTRNRENGALEMYLDGEKQAPDVTSLIPLTGMVIYATGPIYGEPGIHSLSCGHEPKTLVSAKNISKGYPAGADYFELEKYDNGVVSYLYLPDVDSADFDKMQAAKNKRPWRRTVSLVK
jgi:hypothetical protein